MNNLAIDTNKYAGIYYEMAEIEEQNPPLLKYGCHLCHDTYLIKTKKNGLCYCWCVERADMSKEVKRLRPYISKYYSAYAWNYAEYKEKLIDYEQLIYAKRLHISSGGTSETFSICIKCAFRQGFRMIASQCDNNISINNDTKIDIKNYNDVKNCIKFKSEINKRGING